MSDSLFAFLQSSSFYRADRCADGPVFLALCAKCASHNVCLGNIIRESIRNCQSKNNVINFFANGIYDELQKLQKNQNNHSQNEEKDGLKQA